MRSLGLQLKSTCKDKMCILSFLLPILMAVGINVIDTSRFLASYKDLFIIITLIVAMFMGCVYNAMNMISEKEDGVSYINMVLPLSNAQYLVQKIMIGFIFCLLSSAITILLCMNTHAKEIVLTLVIVMFSGYVSSLLGVVIGRISGGMLVGISIIKLVMIIFMTIPLISYFFMGDFKKYRWLFYIVPSTATFDGIMSLLYGNIEQVVRCLLILGVEGVACTVVFWAAHSFSSKIA